MKRGIHIVSAAHVDTARARGLALGDTRFAILDFLRVIRGFEGEPPAEGEPIAIHGLATLLAVAASEERASVAAATRRALHMGKDYFEWKRIPLVFVVDAELGSPLQAEGLSAVRQGVELPIDRVLGASFEAVEGADGWWWSPQMG